MAAAKKGIGLMIGVGPAEEPTEALEAEESSSDLAAKALIRAVKSGDVTGVVEAFRELLAAEDEADAPELEDETEAL